MRDGNQPNSIKEKAVRVAVPREVKNSEYRVALTPAGVHELVAHGHQVVVETEAGIGSSITDDDYRAVGAEIETDVERVWGDAELILKVKEPVESEYQYLRPDQTLFTYLHLAADGPLTDALLAAGTTAIAYETVQLDSGLLPLLYPMSEIAGSLAPQIGARWLTSPQGGRGVLMGGIAGVANAKVVIIGGGAAGQNAANIAVGMGADVTLLDTDLVKLRAVMRWDARVRTLASSALTIREQVVGADLVIGTVLIPGARTPKLVTDEMVSAMKPGSVLVDVAVDQGGCFESSRPTTHEDPTFKVHGSTFYCVANMPGAVPNTSTHALTNATLPYVKKLVDKGWRAALQADPALAKGLATHAGQLVSAPVAEAFGREAVSLDQVL